MLALAAFRSGSRSGNRPDDRPRLRRPDLRHLLRPVVRNAARRRLARRSSAGQDANGDRRLPADGRWSPGDGVDSLFLVALLLIIVGAGGVIGNMAAQVGLLYAPDDNRRTRAFGVYLITLNIGALAAPLVIGTLGEKVAWHYGFGAAGVGMIIGLVTYLVWPPLPAARHDPCSRRTHQARQGRAAARPCDPLPARALHALQRILLPGLRNHVRVGRYRREPRGARLGGAGHLDRDPRRRPDDRWSDARRPHLDSPGGARPRAKRLHQDRNRLSRSRRWLSSSPPQARR